jgi:hypothetical protein
MKTFDADLEFDDDKEELKILSRFPSSLQSILRCRRVGPKPYIKSIKGYKRAGNQRKTSASGAGSTAREKEVKRVVSLFLTRRKTQEGLVAAIGTGKPDDNGKDRLQCESGQGADFQSKNEDQDRR